MVSVLPHQTFVVNLEEAAGLKSKWLASKMGLPQTGSQHGKFLRVWIIKAALFPDSCHSGLRVRKSENAEEPGPGGGAREKPYTCGLKPK